jgi:hypothetical protein
VQWLPRSIDEHFKNDEALETIKDKRSIVIRILQRTNSSEEVIFGLLEKVWLWTF